MIIKDYLKNISLGITIGGILCAILSIVLMLFMHLWAGFRGIDLKMPLDERIISPTLRFGLGGALWGGAIGLVYTRSDAQNKWLRYLLVLAVGLLIIHIPYLVLAVKEKDYPNSLIMGFAMACLSLIWLLGKNPVKL